MAHSRRNIYSYTRAMHKYPIYSRSRSYGQVWPIVTVLLLIVVLAGGAVWVYLNRQGEEVEVASKESEALVPQTARSQDAEPEPAESPASAEMPDAGAEEEDEFAAILEELNIQEEEAVSKEPREPSERLAREDQVATPPSPEPIEPSASEEEEFKGAMKEPKEGGKVPTAAELGMPVEEKSIVPEQPAKAKPAERSREGTQAFAPSQQEQRAEERAIANTVTVERGDSLSTIAERVYGDPGKWRLLYQANQDKLDDPNQLLVGTKLVIPAEKE